MNRRHFIGLLGSAAGWPIVARAQQAMPVVGYLGGSTPDRDEYQLRSIREGLREAGYINGQNVTFESRWAENRNGRLPALAADLVRRQVAVIALGGLPPALAAKAATTTIPIVFQLGVDPVATGLVASLARPGGNLTGVSNLNAELGPKRLELRAGPHGKGLWAAHQPDQPRRGEHREGHADGGRHARNSVPRPACKRGARHRCGVCKPGPLACRWAPGRHRRISDSPRRATWRAEPAPCDAHGFPDPRIHHSRRRDELWRRSEGRVSSGRGLRRPDFAKAKSRPIFRCRKRRRRS